MSLKVKRKLLVISCSNDKSRLYNTEAIYVYNGPYYRILRKANLSNKDILIISAKYGAIDSNVRISFYNKKMTKKRATELKDKVSLAIEESMHSGNYDEVFFELGKNYIDTVSIRPSDYPEVRLIFDHGTIGVRLHNLKTWLEQDLVNIPSKKL